MSRTGSTSWLGQGVDGHSRHPLPSPDWGMGAVGLAQQGRAREGKSPSLGTHWGLTEVLRAESWSRFCELDSLVQGARVVESRP